MRSDFMSKISEPVYVSVIPMFMNHYEHKKYK